jgi:hypothetical protein
MRELLMEYVEANCPGTSLAFDPKGRLIHIQNDDLTQLQFDSMVAVLKASFPGAF